MRLHGNQGQGNRKKTYNYVHQYIFLLKRILMHALILITLFMKNCRFKYFKSNKILYHVES